MSLYFDQTATTQVSKAAVEIMTTMMMEIYGNPSSLHREGMRAEDEVSKARRFFAKHCHVTEKEIYFTSGGTEGNNLVVLGIPRACHRKGKHLITTTIEHPSVMNAFNHLEEVEGFEVTRLEVGASGHIDIEQLQAAIRDDTTLVSIMQVNNEVGTIQDVQQIGRIIKEMNPSTYFHVDGVQGFGKYPIHLKKSCIDAYTVSGHKLHGPKGIGFAYIKAGTKIQPLIFGGAQQLGLRPGTENAPGIVGFHTAVASTINDMEADYKKVMDLKEYLLEKLEEKLPHWHNNSPLSKGEFLEEVASPYIVNVRSESLKGEVILHSLEDYDICVSTGSACSSKKLNVSHVLKAIGLSDVENDRSIRISLSSEHTHEDIDALIQACMAIDTMFARFVKK